jgi:hypothetical protein
MIISEIEAIREMLKGAVVRSVDYGGVMQRIEGGFLVTFDEEHGELRLPLRRYEPIPARYEIVRRCENALSDVSPCSVIPPIRMPKL